MRSYKDLGIASPRAYVRLMDLYTGESLKIAQDTLLSARTNRSIGSSGSASLSFANGNGEWRDTSGRVQPKVNGAPWGHEVDRLDVWDILYMVSYGIGKPIDNTKSKILVTMRSRPFVSLSSTPASSRDSQTSQFMRAIFIGDQVFRDVNSERMSRYNDIVKKLVSGNVVSPYEVSRFLTANLYVMLRTRVEVDFTDFRGYVFPAFTGFVSDIDDSIVTGGLSTIDITCKDWMEVWKETLMVNRSGLMVVEQMQAERAQQSGANQKIAQQSVLGNTTPEEAFKILISIVNASGTLKGYCGDMIKDLKSLRVSRDKTYPMLWGPASVTTEDGKTQAWDRTHPLKLNDSQSASAPLFLYTDRFWDEVLPYISGPFMYDGDTPPTLPSSGFRYGRPAMYDAAFSSKYRQHAPLALQLIIGNTLDMFQNQTVHPYEQMTPIIQRTFADFFVAATGDLVFKLPYLNHLPSLESPWDLPDGIKAYEVWDSGFGKTQLPEVFHGMEYILTPYGRISPRFSYTDTGKFTKVRSSFGVSGVQGSITPYDFVLQDGIQTAPLELQAFFGVREFTTTGAMSQYYSESMKWYAGSLLPMLNWKDNSISVTYQKVLPWELGKNVYVPERNWLYRLNNISYNWIKGSSFTATLQGDFGHPMQVLLPIPWSCLYDGERVEYDPTECVKHRKLVKSTSSWATSYVKAANRIVKVFSSQEDLGSFEDVNDLDLRQKQIKKLEEDPTGVKK